MMLPGHAEPRTLRLSGPANFRDLGGLESIHGKIGAGKIFRSDRLSHLTASDIAILDGLSLRAIFDLRARSEREADPTAWTSDGVTTHVFRPGHKRRLVDMAAEYPPTQAGAKALMLDFYAELPRVMSHVFSEILFLIGNGAFPCIIHCSAGKDRTGMAVALLLAALGCSRETIIADYEASARAVRLEDAMARSVVKDESSRNFGTRYPAEAIAVLTAATPDYILAALGTIDREFGGIDAYLNGLGVDAAVKARLRHHLLETADKGGET